MVMTYQTLLPHIAGSRGSSDVGDPATLADRLQSEAAATRAQIISKPQVCAWAIRP
jgi:hypothetical protein